MFLGGLKPGPRQVHVLAWASGECCQGSTVETLDRRTA